MLVDTKKYPYVVRIDWQVYINWNKICIEAIEHYGLPGSKYMVNSTADYMDFCFKCEKDAIWFKLII